jgi:hypothetical protein
MILTPLLQAVPTAVDIVRQADQFRGFGTNSFSFNLVIVSYQPEKTPESNGLSVKVKSAQSLVEFVSPNSVKGRAMLFEGRNLWLHIPKTRKVIRISPAQRLMGETSNGDVAATDFSGDYTPTLIDEQTVENTLSYHLILEAVDVGVTYHKIEYWVARDTGKPVMSKHFAISGKLLKTAFYKSFIKVGSQEKLEKLLLVNPLFEGRYTWMIYSNYRKEEFPDTLFRKENLNRL